MVDALRVAMKLSPFFCFLMAAVIFSGCNTEPDPNRLSDELVVSTNYDPEANFNNYDTYALAVDTIGFVSNSSSDTIITANDSNFPRPVLQAVKNNLDKVGLTPVDKTADPDLGVNVIVINDFNVFQQVVYPDPYYYGGGYYSNYYGYGGAYYYPYIDTYSYNTAVLVIELVDLKNRNQNNQVRVVWNAYMGDLVSTFQLVPQTEAAIDQAFKQSPYLNGSL
jgi:hypothetical protein